MNFLTLEITENMSDYKFLASYNISRHKSAIFLLIVNSVCNLCVDIYALISTICASGYDIPRSQYFTKVVLPVDICVVAFTIFMRFCIQKFELKFRGLIAIICAIGISALTEILFNNPHVFGNIDMMYFYENLIKRCFVIFSMVSLCSVVGEDNFVIVMGSYVWNTCYIIIRRAMCILKNFYFNSFRNIKYYRLCVFMYIFLIGKLRVY